MLMPTGVIICGACNIELQAPLHQQAYA